MTDQPSDPIAAAVEGVCDNWELLPVEDDTVEEEWQDCIHCKHPQWRHWLRVLRDQLAETEAQVTTLEARWACLTASMPHVAALFDEEG